MSITWVLLAFAVLMVLVFDFTNGFHDASNMVATLVASWAMTPAQALLLVGAFTFIGPIAAGTAVADTIGGFVSLQALPNSHSVTLVLCGVLAAVGWNLLTWWLAMPSSSSWAGRTTR